MLGQTRTLVFASHNLGQVKRLATRVLYLEQGRVLADLSVQDFSAATCCRAITPKPIRLFKEKSHEIQSAQSPSCTVQMVVAAFICGANGPAQAQAESIVISSTTSTEQSGLFGHLMPVFIQATGIATKVVALGTGQALDMARRGDADVVFVHDQVAEEKFCGRRLWPATPACDVQRLCAHRPPRPTLPPPKAATSSMP